MENKIEWSEEALANLSTILNYIESNFGVIVASNFLAEIDEVLEILLHYPYIGKPECKTENIHSLIIHKKTTLYYSYSFEIIKLIDFFDNRQDPSKKTYL